MHPEYLCRCPRCGGLGHLCDGMASFGPGNEHDYRPPTPCSVCKGVGYGEFKAIDRPDRMKTRMDVQDPNPSISPNESKKETKDVS